MLIWFSAMLSLFGVLYLTAQVSRYIEIATGRSYARTPRISHFFISLAVIAVIVLGFSGFATLLLPWKVFALGSASAASSLAAQYLFGKTA